MSSILLTGGSGHVGFAVLREALSQGYKVRAAVRSQSKADAIKSARSIQQYLSQLDFAIVQDITKSGAFDEAVKGVDAILHVASPIPSSKIENHDEDMIKPAVRGTTSILYSALKEKSIRKVVVTSSVIAVWPGDDDVFTADNIVEEVQGPYDDTFAAYRSSKVAAHSIIRKFRKEEKPHFNIVSFMPGYVIGANELATSIEEIDSGSNEVMLAPILGRNNEQGAYTIVVHLDDVAFTHVAALDSKIKGDCNFGLVYDSSHMSWEACAQIAKEQFPEAAESGMLPLNGRQKDLRMKFDASETEKVFGIKFKDPGEMVKSIVAQYLQAASRSS